MSALLVLAPAAGLDAFPLPDPHPELVLAQRPDVSQFMQAAIVLGVYPESSYLSGELSLTGR